VPEGDDGHLWQLDDLWQLADTHAYMHA